VKITEKQNKFYRKLLEEIRTEQYPWVKQKEFSSYVKKIDPDFPTDVSGEPVSIRDIEPKDFLRHLMFIKKMAIKRGMKSDLFSSRDYGAANATSYTARIAYRDGGIVGVVCSNCGAISDRKLTQDRIDELELIGSGKAKEKMDPLSESFVCAWCMSNILKEK